MITIFSWIFIIYISIKIEPFKIIVKQADQANYGIEGATVVGCGVSEAVLEKFVSALQNTPYGNEAPSADGFRAGEVSYQQINQEYGSNGYFYNRN